PPIATSRFPAFQYPNYRLFWVGNFISVIGGMIHQTGEGWLVRELTSDPRVVTGVTACYTLPLFFLALFSGVIADRVDKRQALSRLNSVAAALVFLLSFLVWSELVQVWHVMLIAFLSGSITAF